MRGIGPWRMAFVTNVALALVAPLFLIGAAPATAAARWEEPVLAGLCFYIGQIFTFQALDRGDLSVATPILGTKAVFVAFFSVFLLHLPIPWQLWTAAVLTALAVALLGGGGTGREHHTRFLFTAGTAALGAMSFACGDVLTQKWGPGWGAARFTFWEMAFCAAFSPLLIPFFRQPLSAIDRPTWKWLGGGSFVNALQACILYISIGHFGHATEMNVTYNFRSLVMLGLIWAVGHWFHNHERHAGTRVMLRRLAGALLLLSAIFLVTKH